MGAGPAEDTGRVMMASAFALALAVGAVIFVFGSVRFQEWLDGRRERAKIDEEYKELIEESRGQR